LTQYNHSEIIKVPPPRDVAEAIERQQKLDLLTEEQENTTSNAVTQLRRNASLRRNATPATGSPPPTAMKRLRLMEDDEEEESRVATEVENILSGKVLDTDISGIPEIEELMSTESKFTQHLIERELNPAK
jgi:hypothetical protein